MRVFIFMIGIGAAFGMLRYREQVGDMIGGRYQWIVAAGVLVFFWSIAYLVGAGDIFFRPILWILPISR